MEKLTYVVTTWKINDDTFRLVYVPEVCGIAEKYVVEIESYDRMGQPRWSNFCSFLKPMNLTERLPFELCKLLDDTINSNKKVKREDCECCKGTGRYGDKGPGTKNNREYHPCDQCKQ